MRHQDLPCGGAVKIICNTVAPFLMVRIFAYNWLIVPRVRRSTLGARAFAIAGPTVWNSLPDSLRDPAVGPDQFRRDLKTHLFDWHCVSFSALAVFSRNALYKSTFYLLYLLTVDDHLAAGLYTSVTPRLLTTNRTFRSTNWGLIRSSGLLVQPRDITSHTVL